MFFVLNIVSDTNGLQAVYGCFVLLEIDTWVLYNKNITDP
jgi:hypothetical protein